MKKYIYSLLALFFMTGCLKDEKIHTSLQLSLDFPEEFADMDRTPIVVTLRNTSNGVQYKSNCDANGIASFSAEYGFYEASFQHKHIDNESGVIHIFNGRFENIVLSQEMESKNATPYPMEIIAATSAQLIIKEFYPYGCIGNDGKNYTYDTYLCIYNNSNQVAYLDSICIGMVTPMVSNSPSRFMVNGSLPDFLPLDQMAWQFPGTGKDYPLQPGEECVVAYSAINHKALHPNSIDLSKADYAFWTEEFDMSSSQVQKPAIGVKHMECIWRTKNTTKAFPIANTAKAMILFRIEGQSAAAYVANPDNITKAPDQPTGLDYLKVPQEWVLDGIECVTSAERNNKRIPTSVDAGFFFIEGGAAGCGLAAIRKVEEIADGRIVYQDTNNSSLDLESGTPTWKNR